ncbi:hypothetical protein ACHQM5_017647 [Ranunculus cassubicifolius]
MNLSSRILSFLQFISFVSFSCYNVHSQITPKNIENSDQSISAIIVFGDSTVDPGNNNYINTVFKSDFLPYGMDLPSHIPTGRFTNGKLVTDFIASYLGIKEYVPPYLNKSLSREELISGVSFASAASGYDPLTPQIDNVIPMTKQLEYFKEYKERLGQIMGNEKMESHIRNAVFFVSCGTNDFGVNYFNHPVRRTQFNVSDYQKFVIENTRKFLQGLLDLGALKIGVVGLPPIGCLPVLVTENSFSTFPQRQCVESYSAVAKQYNLLLQNELQTIQKTVADSGVLMVYADIYEPLLNLIKSPKNYGFEDWNKGCCGTGLVETIFLCNPMSLVCPDPSKFIFWDSIHPTEKVYYLLFLELRESTVDRLT